MSTTGPFIKQEPLDDDGFSAYNSIPLAVVVQIEYEEEPTFVEEETILKRATNHPDRPHPTVCFEQPHIQHLYHHRLFCGHDIVTDNLERCGSSCAPSKNQKPRGVPFECPDPACVRKAKVLRPKKNASKPRKCIISHVCGRDAAADQERREEKSNDRTLRSKQVLRGTGLVCKQNESPSPARKKPCTINTVKDKKSLKIDRGETLDRELEQEPDREKIMAFSGPGVEQNMGGRIKTDAEKA